MRNTIFIVFFLSGLLVQGQSGYVNQIYDIDEGGNYSDEIIQTNSGYVVIGSSSKNGLRSTSVMGLDHYLNKSWLRENIFEHGTTSYFGFIDELILSNDNNILIVGRKAVYVDSLGGRITQHIFLRKYSPSGDSVWFKQYPVSGTNHYVSGLEQLPDGSIYTGGFVTDTIAGPTDCYLMKLDKEGNLIWKKRYEVKDDQELYCIESDINNNLYLSGWEVYNGKAHSYIKKVDSSGNELWHRRFTGKYGARMMRISKLNSGAVVGAFWRYDDRKQPNTDTYYGPAVVVKLDTAGNEVWKKAYGKPQSLNLMAEIVEYDNGDLALAGIQGNLLAYPDGWIMRLNSEGDSLWSRNYKYYRKGLRHNHYLLSVVKSDDGGVIAGGHVIPDYSMQPTATQDIWLVKTDGNGCLFEGCDTACATMPEVNYSSEQIGDYKFRFINTTENTLNAHWFVHNKYRGFHDTGNVYEFFEGDTVIFDFGREGTGYVELRIETECLHELYLLDSFPVTKPSGTDELNKNNFSVYPNPARSRLHVKSPPATNNTLTYQIITATGRQVQRDRLSAAGTIRLSEMAAGVYLLQLYDGEGVLVGRERFVKE